MSEYKALLNQILFRYVNKLVEGLYFNTHTSISISMLYYMDKIYMAQKITPSVLAKEMNVSRPASTKMIKKLIHLGLVERHESEHKGNTFTVSLTDKGLEIYKISNRMDIELIDLLDKHINFKNIEDIDEKLTKLLHEYER